MDKFYRLAEVKTTDEDGVEFESVLSAPTLDRDFEVIDANAFAPLPDSVPVHAFHDFHDPVGRAVPYYDDGVLKVKGTFASTPRAQEIRTLVKEGVIGAMSVGFMSATRETADDGVTHIVKAEVLEGSFVSVPSNRESAILMAKDYREAAVKIGSRNNEDDAARLQAIHDLATENGAKCVTPDDARATGGDVEPGSTFVVGEKGPEMFVPGDKLDAVVRKVHTDMASVITKALQRKDVKTKGDEDSTGPVMAPGEQARLAIARLEADLLLNS